MCIFERLTDNPSFQDVIKQAALIPETVSSPEPERLEPARVAYKKPLRPWSEVPLIEMLPAEYRAEAQKILAKNPSKARILEMGKLGVFDCWTAMERLEIIL
ncbi:MAG: hypothetical protein ACLQPD_02380 [Desulfomonilaceae bacterium]